MFHYFELKSLLPINPYT